VRRRLLLTADAAKGRAPVLGPDIAPRSNGRSGPRRSVRPLGSLAHHDLGSGGGASGVCECASMATCGGTGASGGWSRVSVVGVSATERWSGFETTCTFAKNGLETRSGLRVGRCQVACEVYQSSPTIRSIASDVIGPPDRLLHSPATSQWKATSSSDTICHTADNSRVLCFGAARRSLIALENGRLTSV
jgi:hypothetical protein